jgi:acetyl-CoA acetyltransferase
MGSTGRRWRTPATQENAPVHADRTRERERAHRRVSRVADGKAKLTVAQDGAQAQWRPRNRRWVSAGGGGALGLCGQSEREGERARQRAQMREGRWASVTPRI